MKKGLFIGLAAAMLLAVPVMADGELEFTVDTDSSGTYYSWDSETKTLTLENGFEVTAVNTEKDHTVNAIKVPYGTTIIVEGDAEIHSDENGILVAGLDDEGDEIDNPDPLKIQINKGAELSIDCGYDAITSYNYDVERSTYTDIIITGQDRDTSILDIDGEYGLYTDGNISVKNVGITIETEYGCICAYYGNITIKDSTLDLTSTGYYEYETEYYYEYECYDGIYADENVTISNSNVTIESGSECIYADDRDIKITGSTLNLESKYSDGIDSDDGYINIDSCKITLSCENECIEAEKYITITNTSLDLCSTTGNGIFDLLWKSENLDVIHEMYQNNISLDCKFILYGENDKRLHNNPIEYSADLIVSDLDSGEDTWYYNNERVYRLVTVNEVDDYDTTASIEKVFRSLRTVSFSGEGTSALKELYRAFGSTINLNKFTPAAREGYTFTGWYADAACTKPITRLVVTGDMEIYAGWEAIAVEEETEAEEENN